MNRLNEECLVFEVSVKLGKAVVSEVGGIHDAFGFDSDVDDDDIDDRKDDNMDLSRTGSHGDHDELETGEHGKKKRLNRSTPIFLIVILSPFSPMQYSLSDHIT